MLPPTRTPNAIQMAEFDPGLLNVLCENKNLLNIRMDLFRNGSNDCNWLTSENKGSRGKLPAHTWISLQDTSSDSSFLSKQQPSSA